MRLFLQSLEAVCLARVEHGSCSSHMTGVHVRHYERSRYGYDVAVRIGDGGTPSRWDSCLQEECVITVEGSGVPLVGRFHLTERSACDEADMPLWASDFLDGGCTSLRLAFSS
jgi:hypothetical protein